METVKIKYVRLVTHPPARIGKVGDIKEVDVRTARVLINGGFAVEVKDADKRTDTKSR